MNEYSNPIFFILLRVFRFVLRCASDSTYRRNIDLHAYRAPPDTYIHTSFSPTSATSLRALNTLSAALRRVARREFIILTFSSAGTSNTINMYVVLYTYITYKYKYAPSLLFLMAFCRIIALVHIYIYIYGSAKLHYEQNMCIRRRRRRRRARLSDTSFCHRAPT